jgi:cation:H+ antiporter
MEIFTALGSIILWLILLVFGGNALVDGAVSIAKKYKISEAIIGLTIVAIGTSMPELIVSVLASISGNTEIAIGNVLGSNIANIFLILGITAMISPMVLTRNTRFFDLPIVILSSLVFLILVSDIVLDGALTNSVWRTDGIILVSLALAYIVYSVRHNNFVPDESEEVEIISSVWKAWLWIVGGISILLIGGKLLVAGSVDIAKMWGLSESIIGLTIVAIGTSTPELATSIIAARRGNPDIAVGNIVGSNIMNLLVILGMSSIMAPLPFLGGSFIDLGLAILAPITILLLSLVWTRNQISRKEWVILLSIYLVYLAYLIFAEIS